MNGDSVQNVKEVIVLSYADLLQFGTVDGKQDLSMVLTFIKGDKGFEIILTRQEFLDLAAGYDKLIWGYAH